MCASRFLVALLAIAPLLAAQETSVEVLTVRNRPAADLVAPLQGLAGRQGSVTSLENKLIVRATPDALRQIKAVLLELDVAPRSLWITVRQTTALSSSTQAAEVTLSTPAGNGGVRLSHDGATVTTTRSRTVVSGSFGAGSSSDAGNDVSPLMALEGRPAFIRAGSAMPVSPGVVAAPDGAVVAGTAYVEAATGFWVLPRLSGDVVTLELATTQDAFGVGAAIDQRHARTTLAARLGDWVHVGGIGGGSASRAAGIGSVAGVSSTADWDVDLKVEAVLAP